ncbi:MAG: hypothetical protein EPN31_13745 [Castellaniella sp.]|uniref:hypothetical protein n=1 Tax=Castellaniella sp. TaxID=1955812 RepID=UPI001223DC04|nr:hypothetical protein [Castellaniella sp.]TAN26315.1 MAG: hypothetical protein EPN31_13745 [Castellaniella sp.]
MNRTIDTATARRMAEAGVIRGVSIVGQPGGWSVMLKTGRQEKPLGGQKTDRPRTWRSLDTLTEYLRKDLSIVRIDGIDATHHSSEDAHRPGRPDAAARMKRAHEAAAYDAWFRDQVDAGIEEADNRATQWISHEESVARMHRHLDLLEAKAKDKG